MATPKISIRIGLDGKEEVVSGLGEIKSKGLDTFNALKNTAGSALGDGGRKASQQIRQLGLHSLEAKKTSEVIREALHVVHPVLEAAGLGLSNLRAYALAANAGLLGLAAAMAGAATVGLVKYGDQAKKTAAAIDDFYGPEKGKKYRESLLARSKQLGVGIEDLAAPEKSAAIAQRLRGVPAREGTGGGDISSTFEELGQIGALGPGEGAASAKELFASFAQQGAEQPGKPQVLTAAMFSKLPTIIQDAFAKALGAKSPEDLLGQINAPGGGRKIDLEELLRVRERIAPDVEKRYAQIPLERQTVGGELSRTLEAAKVSPLAPIGGAISNFVIRQLKEVGLELERSPEAKVPSPTLSLLSWIEGRGGPTRATAPAARVEPPQDFAHRFTPRETPFTPTRRVLPGSEAPHDFAHRFAPPGAPPFTTPNFGHHGAFGPALDGLKTSADGTSLALDKTAESARKAADAQTRQAEDLEKQQKEESLRGARLHFEQAGLARKYEPEEAQSRLAHAALGIESADESAEQASLNVRKAKYNLANAGGREVWVGDSLEPTIVGAASPLERAQLRLNLKKAETDERSAALEQSDSRLRFAKDQEGQPVSHELQGLEYDEAQTRYLAEIAANTAKSAQGGPSSPPGEPPIAAPAAAGVLPPESPITFPPEPHGLRQFLNGPYAQSIPISGTSFGVTVPPGAAIPPGLAAPLGIPPAGQLPSTAQVSPTVDTTPLKTGVNDAGSALEGLASRIRGIQFPSQVPSGSAGGAGGAAEGTAQGQALGGIIGLSEGGALNFAARTAAAPTIPSAAIPGFARGGEMPGVARGASHSLLSQSVAALLRTGDGPSPISRATGGKTDGLRNFRMGGFADLPGFAEGGKLEAMARPSGYPVGGWHAIHPQTGEVLKRAGAAYGDLAPRFKTPEKALAFGSKVLGSLVDLTGHAEGGVIADFARGGALPDKSGALGKLPGFVEGGHVLARVSNGEHFFPPKEIAAIGLPALHAMNGFAGGGRIRGPGTGTSDSILASLPRGGFVLNAHAAGMIGDHTLNHLHAMADGGHVDHFSGLQGSPVAMPSLNGNKGHNGGSGDFHLHWPDGSSTSMPMARDVLDELSEKSALYRIASGGRRSSAQS